eukprot:m.233606 g.233606  ORF g.233606 m.233606 type:complete len:55 (-) comp17385_c2_seq27:1128-1292(-)
MPLLHPLCTMYAAALTKSIDPFSSTLILAKHDGVDFCQTLPGDPSSRFNVLILT